MPSHVALLRGVNVGDAKLAMADLREAVSALGYTDVATYIQSGNVVFTAATGSPARGTSKIAAAIEKQLEADAGLTTTVIVLSSSELRKVVDANPYADESNPKFVHAVFRRERVTKADAGVIADIERQAGDKGSEDEATVIGKVVYLHTPGGIGRSELATRLARSPLANGPDGGGTARNWSTVTKLLELLDG